MQHTDVFDIYEDSLVKIVSIEGASVNYGVPIKATFRKADTKDMDKTVSNFVNLVVEKTSIKPQPVTLKNVHHVLSSNLCDKDGGPYSGKALYFHPEPPPIEKVTRKEKSKDKKDEMIISAISAHGNVKSEIIISVMSAHGNIKSESLFICSNGKLQKIKTRDEGRYRDRITKKFTSWADYVSWRNSIYSRIETKRHRNFTSPVTNKASSTDFASSERNYHYRESSPSSEKLFFW